MTRAEFLSTVPLLPAAAAQTAKSGGSALRNRAFEVTVDSSAAGVLVRVVHRPSGMELAAAPYSYALGAPLAMRLTVSGGQFTLEGLLHGHIEVVHTIRVPAGEPWIEEEISFRNRGSQPVWLSNPRCGFVLPVKLEDKDTASVCAVLENWAHFERKR